MVAAELETRSVTYTLTRFRDRVLPMTHSTADPLLSGIQAISLQTLPYDPLGYISESRKGRLRMWNLQYCVFL
jgi:hypothetical protein